MSYPVPLTLQGGDIIQCVARMYWRSQLAMNTYWYKKDPADPEQDLYPALADWDVQARGVYLPLMNGQARWLDSILYYYRGASWSQAFFSSSPQSAGTMDGNPIPTQVAGIITRRKLGVGNRNRGRVYIPFPATFGLGVDEEPTTEYVLLLNNLAETLMPLAASMPVDARSWDPGLCARETPTATWNTLIDVRAQSRWATQRRRGDFGSPNIT